jgi:hypothetical protein
VDFKYLAIYGLSDDVKNGVDDWTTGEMLL